MAERLTADELIARLDVTRDELKTLHKAGLKAVRTKGGDRYGWPATLHWYVRFREQAARQELPDHVTQRQFARLTGKVDRTLYNWRQQGLPSAVNPSDSRHPLIPLAGAVRWLVERAEKRDDHADPADLVDLDRKREELKLTRIKVAREEGTIVDIETMKRELEELTHATLAVLEAMPGQLDEELAALSDAAAVRQRLAQEITSVREEWADALVRVAERTSDLLTAAEDEEADDGPPNDEADP